MESQLETNVDDKENNMDLRIEDGSTVTEKTLSDQPGPVYTDNTFSLLNSDNFQSGENSSFAVNNTTLFPKGFTTIDNKQTEVMHHDAVKEIFHSSIVTTANDITENELSKCPIEGGKSKNCLALEKHIYNKEIFETGTETKDSYQKLQLYGQEGKTTQIHLNKGYEHNNIDNDDNNINNNNNSNNNNNKNISSHHRDSASSKDLDLSVNKDKASKGNINESIGNLQKDKLLLNSSVVTNREAIKPFSVPALSIASSIPTQSSIKRPLTYANVVAPPNVHENPTTGYTKECAVIMERLHATSLDTYVEAIWDTMKQKAITYIGQAPDDPTSVLAFVKTQDLADLLIRQGIWIGWKWIKVSALQQRATKIVISGALPFITDISIAQQLSPYGQLAYPQFRRIPAATRAASHKGILSFRREAFIILYEHKQIPERITLLEEGKLYTLEVSSEGPKCYRCGQRGHLASTCRTTRGRVELSQPVRSQLQQPQGVNQIQTSVSNTATHPITSGEEEEEERAWTEVRSRKRKLQRTELNSAFTTKSIRDDKVVSRDVRTVKYDLISYVGGNLPITKSNPDIGELATTNDGNSKQVNYISDNLARDPNFIKTGNSMNNKRENNNMSQRTPGFVAGTIDALQSKFVSNSVQSKTEFKIDASRILSKEIPLKLEGSKSQKRLTVLPDEGSTDSFVLGSHLNNDSQSSEVQIKKTFLKRNTVNGHQSDESKRWEEKSEPKKILHSEIVTKHFNDCIENGGNTCFENKSTDIIPRDVLDRGGFEKSGLPLAEEEQVMEKFIDKMGSIPDRSKNNKTRFLIEQLISESKNLRVSRRKELVSKYVMKIPNLRYILQMMVKQGDDTCCPKGSPPYKRMVMIIDDIMDIERTPKTRAENKKPPKREEHLRVPDSSRDGDAEAYWKKHPPDESNEMDYIETVQHPEQDPDIYGGTVVSLLDISHNAEYTQKFDETTTCDQSSVGKKKNKFDNSYQMTESEISDPNIFRPLWNTQ